MPSETTIDFAAGCLGGAAGVLVGHPLDTLKVKLQTQSFIAPEYGGCYRCFRTILANEGLRGFYKGLSSPLASLAFINAVIFGVHGHVVKQFEDRSSLVTHFFAGACAGSAQALISSPMELLKLRVQLSGNSSPLTPYSYLKSILHSKDYKVLLRGMISTQLRDTPGLGVYFASYQYLARRLSKDGTMEALTAPQLIFAGGTAGMISWLFNYPVDVVKTRFQSDNIHQNYGELISRTYLEGGFRSFFSGFIPTMLRAFPTNAATFFTVEWTYRLLINKDYTSCLSDQYQRLTNIGIPDIELIAEGQSGKAILERRRPIYTMTVQKLWRAKTFLLPEAGTTLMEPFICLKDNR